MPDNNTLPDKYALAEQWVKALTTQGHVINIIRGLDKHIEMSFYHPNPESHIFHNQYFFFVKMTINSVVVKEERFYDKQMFVDFVISLIKDDNYAVRQPQGWGEYERK